MSATAASIETAYINGFKSGFDQQFQQTESVFMPYVEVVTQQSEFDFYDRVGIAPRPQQDTERYGLNPAIEIDVDRRRIDFKDFEMGKYIDPKDLKRVGTDPTAPMTMQMAHSFKREIDYEIIEGVFADAYTGKKGQTIVSWPDTTAGKITVGEVSKGTLNPISTGGEYQLAEGNQEGIVIDGRYQAGGTALGEASGITIDKLHGLRYTMMRIGAINQADTINLFLPSVAFRQLLDIEKIINSDYTTKARLENGQVTDWGGFRFIHSELIPTDDDGLFRCIALANNNREGRMGIKLAMAENIQIDMWPDSSRKNIPYIYGKMKLKAHRFWGEITSEIKVAG